MSAQRTSIGCFVHYSPVVYEHRRTRVDEYGSRELSRQDPICSGRAYTSATVRDFEPVISLMPASCIDVLCWCFISVMIRFDRNHGRFVITEGAACKVQRLYCSSARHVDVDQPSAEKRHSIFQRYTSRMLFCHTVAAQLSYAFPQGTDLT